RIFHIRKSIFDLRLTAIGEDNLLIAPALPAQTQAGSCSPLRGRKVLKAKPERKAPRGTRARWASKDPKETLEQPDHKVRKGIRDPLVRRDLPDLAEAV